VRRGFNVLTAALACHRTDAEFRRSSTGRVRVKQPQPLEVGVQRAVYVADNDADARAAEQARWNMRVTLSLRNNYQRVEQGRACRCGADGASVDDCSTATSSSARRHCVRQIKRIQKAVGITHFNCSFWFGDLEHARVLRSMETFAREVMPAFA